MDLARLKSMDIFEIQSLMEDRGYWMVLKSPFEKGCCWSCGDIAQEAAAALAAFDYLREG